MENQGIFSWIVVATLSAFDFCYATEFFVSYYFFAQWEIYCLYSVAYQPWKFFNLFVVIYSSVMEGNWLIMDSIEIQAKSQS